MESPPVFFVKASAFTKNTGLRHWLHFVKMFATIKKSKFAVISLLLSVIKCNNATKTT